MFCQQKKLKNACNSSQNSMMQVVEQYTQYTQYYSINEKKSSQWKIQQLHDEASDIWIKQHRILVFGFPVMQQIVWPFQTARISTGWKLYQMPDDCRFHTLPDSSLLDNQLISSPNNYVRNDGGTQITQTLLNASNYPIYISSRMHENNQYIQTNLMKLCPQKLKIIQTVNVSQLFTGLLGDLQYILPIFI